MWMKNLIEFFRATAIVKWMAGRMSVGCAFGFFIYYFVFYMGDFCFLERWLTFWVVMVYLYLEFSN